MSGDSCTIKVSRSNIDDSGCINYKSIMIIKMTPQLGASLTEYSRGVIYDCNMLKVHATEYIRLL
jgi:hypothetical protein